ncbi:hypothetical protein RAC89_05120 [Paenibacillus sp. GD4]|uniref:hypothetical protein n=1 Tax=Paenibacillus sp. GD4 TaxID=3068890 RepID=UPI0027967CE3|nr:hypothetical protein [Paenibacillus sp. GD4]MDQ1909887.1 hypothetical protein [Paenibacillus sp. GD4]
MELMIEFFMWLVLFASILICFSTLLLEFILKDSTNYDMEFLWEHRYSLQDLHLNENREDKEIT